MLVSFYAILVSMAGEIIQTVMVTMSHLGSLRFIFTAPRSVLLQNQFVLQFFIVSFSGFTIFLAAPTSSSDFIIHEGGTMSYAFLKSIQTMFKLVFLLLQFLMAALSMRSRSFLSHDLRLNPFCSSGKRS